MRLGLAIRAFFAILFGRVLPVELLPEPGDDDSRGALPASTDATPPADPKRDEAPEEPPAAPEPEPAAPAVPDAAQLEAAAVQVLAVLQSEGRLLDFLSEDITGYSDEEVGAAVRDVHKGLKKALGEHFPIVPVRDEEEESPITVPKGFDPASIRLVGKVVGEPPFSGTLKHKGWKVTAVRLPRAPAGDGARVAAPAEVEL